MLTTSSREREREKDRDSERDRGYLKKIYNIFSFNALSALSMSWLGYVFSIKKLLQIFFSALYGFCTVPCIIIYCGTVGMVE